MFVAASVCYWGSLKPVVHKYLFGMDTLCCLITLPGYLLQYGYSKFQNASEEVPVSTTLPDP